MRRRNIETIQEFISSSSYRRMWKYSYSSYCSVVNDLFEEYI